MYSPITIAMKIATLNDMFIIIITKTATAIIAGIIKTADFKGNTTFTITTTVAATATVIHAVADITDNPVTTRATTADAVV